MAAPRTETLRLILSGDGKLLSAELSKSENKIKTFSEHSRSMLRGMGRHFQSWGQDVRHSILAPIAGIASAGAIFAATKRIIEFDAALSRLAIGGNATAETQMRLRKEIQETADRSYQSWNAVSEGINAIIVKTGDMDFARQSIKDIGVAATASGATMADMAAVAVGLRDKIGLTKDEILPAFNLITVQGKRGAFTLGDMAAQGERLFSAAQRFNVHGMQQLRVFGSLVQTARMGTGSSEQATTAVENTLADIIDKYKEIRQLAHFSVFKEGKDGAKELKPLEEVIKGIVIGTKGDPTKLAKIFGRESIRAMNTIVADYKKNGGFALFDDIKTQDMGRANQLMEDFARYSKEAAPQLQLIANQMDKFSSRALTPAIREFTKAIQDMSANPERVERIARAAGDIAAGLSVIAKTAVKAGEAMAAMIDVWSKASEKAADWTFGVSKDDKKKGIRPGFQWGRIGQFVDNFINPIGAFYTNWLPMMLTPKKGALQIKIPDYHLSFDLPGIGKDQSGGSPMSLARSAVAKGSDKQLVISPTANTTVVVNVSPSAQVSATTKSEGGHATTRIKRSGSFAPLGATD